MQKIIVIIGPTACGKSAFALDMAKSRNGVIINADSAQVYKSLQVLTDRPENSTIDGIKHELYGFIEDPNQSCNAAFWLENATAKIKNANAIGKTPIIVGGTGLYIKALLDGIVEIPDIDPEIRDRLRAQLKSDGVDNLYQELQIKDPIGAGNLHINDAQRIVRALEVVLSTGKPLHQWHSKKSNNNSGDSYTPFVIYINPPREEVVAKAKSRLEEMFNSGAIAEVKTLLDQGIDTDSPIYKAIGVREIQSYLEGEITLEQALEKAFIATRQYIKRQQTWFNNQIKPDLEL